MIMIYKSKAATEIARELLLSPTTISTYRARVFRKLHLKKRSQLVQYALHHRLIT